MPSDDMSIDEILDQLDQDTDKLRDKTMAQGVVSATDAQMVETLRDLSKAIAMIADAEMSIASEQAAIRKVLRELSECPDKAVAAADMAAAKRLDRINTMVGEVQQQAIDVASSVTHTLTSAQESIDESVGNLSKRAAFGGGMILCFSIVVALLGGFGTWCAVTALPAIQQFFAKNGQWLGAIALAVIVIFALIAFNWTKKR